MYLLSETGEEEKGRKQDRNEVKWNLQGSLTNKNKGPGQSFLNAFLLRSLYRNIHFLREEVNEKKVHFFYYDFNKKISYYLISLAFSSKTKAKTTKADTVKAKQTWIISWLQLQGRKKRRKKEETILLLTKCNSSSPNRTCNSSKFNLFKGSYSRRTSSQIDFLQIASLYFILIEIL